MVTHSRDLEAFHETISPGVPASSSSIGNSSRDAKTRSHDSMMSWGSVVLWYSSAMVTITTSKIILTHMPFLYVACYFQFGIAALRGELVPMLRAKGAVE